MVRKVVVILSVLAGVAVLLGSAPASANGPTPTPGAPGIGDPYFPLDGNGGYDIGEYVLDVTYTPATNLLTGVAEIRALATQALSSFNLDLAGFEVRSVTVDGADAT